MGFSDVIVRSTAAAVLLFAVSVTEVAAQRPDCEAGPHSEIITRDDLTRYAIARLSDVFAFSTRWHTFSLDGYHRRAAPAGLPSENERWSVYVDGVPVATRLLGRNQLNALPVTVFDVECVEIVSGPDLSRTTFSPGGTVYIHTRTPDFGLSIEGAVAVGNEVNDPGPFRYTGTGGANVDRIGPIGTAGVTVNGGEWSGRATRRLEEFHVTDDVLILRQKQLYDVDSKPRIIASSVGLSGSFGPADRRHSLLLGRTETDDLAYFTAVGHEIPTAHRLEVGGGAGRVALQDGEIRYAASYTRGDLGFRSNAENVRLDWRQDRIMADAEVRLHGVRLGGGVRATEAHTRSPLSDPRILTTRLFAGMNADVVPGWHQDLILEWKQRGDRPSAAGYASAAVTINRDHRLTLTGSYGHVLPDDQDLWLWIDRGYALPGADSTDTSPLEDDPLPRLLTLDAVWRGRVADGLQVALRSYLRRTENDYLPTYEIAYAPSTFGFAVNTALRGNVSGTTAGGGVTVDFAHGSTFHHRFAYVAEDVLAGDDAYRDLHARIPSQRIIYSATFAPVDRFSLSTLVRYTAVTSWPDYETVAGRADTEYVWEIPEYFLVDVSASKRMW